MSKYPKIIFDYLRGFDPDRDLDLILINTPLISYPSNNHKPKDLVPPLGLGSLATCCKQAGYNVGLLDAELFQLTIEEIVQIICSCNPFAVGLSCVSPTIGVGCEIVERLPRNIPVIFGGPHVTLMPHLTMLKSNRIDFIIRSEAEFSLPALLFQLKTKREYSCVDGLSYRFDGKITHNKNSELIEKLDGLPFIDRSFFANDLKTKNGLESALITSRGCCYDCIFCSEPILNKKRIRRRSPENVINEMKYLNSEFGVNYFHFMDDHFTLNRKWLERFCLLIENSGLKVKWRALSRVDSIDEEILRLMRNNGCELLAFGIESCSDIILEKIGKKITFKQIKKAIYLCHRVGIQTKGFFMIGFPFETEKDIDFTINSAKTLGLNSAVFNIVRAFPGTVLFEKMLGTFELSDLVEYEEFPTISDYGENQFFNAGLSKSGQNNLFAKGKVSLIGLEKLRESYNVSNKKNISPLGLEKLKEKLQVAAAGFYGDLNT